MNNQEQYAKAVMQIRNQFTEKFNRINNANVKVTSFGVLDANLIYKYQQGIYREYLRNFPQSQIFRLDIKIEDKNYVQFVALLENRFLVDFMVSLYGKNIGDKKILFTYEDYPFRGDQVINANNVTTHFLN